MKSEGRGFRYEIRIPDKGLPVSLDRDAFARILNNLCENVLRHSQGTLFSFTASSVAGKAVIQISDDGVGIPAAEQSRVFERLYQCDASRRSRGNGLGLAITKELVAAHGGAIALQSAPHQGTTFKLTFPQALP